MLPPSTPILAALVLALPLASASSGGEEWRREVRVLMGTTAEVGVCGLEDPLPAFDGAFAALQRVDDSMSLWRPESELRRLNDSGTARLSPDLLAVVRAALDVAEASRGAFDPTVEPLVRASGYLGEPARRLDPDARSRLLALVGWRRVLVDPRASEVRLRGGARLDLGGIAKGYAADLALAALRRAGARAGYVDLGSSSIGAFGGAIAVDLRDPEDPQGAPLGTLRLDEAFLGASGGDQRGTHILDPRSGRPADRATSVTVVARTGVEADALSTAVYVLGPRDGMQLLRRRGAEGLVNWREDGRRRTRATPGFPGAVAAVSDPASARR